MISFIDGYFGWLGNQMFQYAATKALSLHVGTECSFPRNKPSLYDLFPISAAWMRGLDFRVTYQEPHFHFDPAFWDLKNGAVLSGYFQSEKYFAPYAEQIRREFMLPPSYLHIPPLAARGETVSVHVRRGDYLSPELRDHHPPLTMEYYRAAMARFPGARFQLFSDDPGWCLLNFRDAGYKVEISTGHTAPEDMALMASCDHHIIANSSFSWWGAWLGRNPGKRVVAPAAWFGPSKPLPQWDTRDLLPESWEKT